jgi:fatty acid CoA ligase FadD9
LVGDLGEPRLGLDQEVYDRLCDAVDVIVHPAALVNHRLSYENLFEPNVVGTADLVALALTRKQKQFDYISSVAVAGMFGRAGLGAIDTETTDPRAIETVMLGDDYASGYGASKWAGELLLLDAHEQYGLPVNVFRPDMILAHSRYRGQINAPDIFSRLLYSVIKTGLAPYSFYELGPDGERARAHYDGLPVDFVARAIAEIGANSGADYETYNVVNMHDDGVSLDRIVDWVEGEGYSVHRVRDHAEWVRRFEASLQALPEEQRQHSLLAVLGAYSKPYQANAPAQPNGRFQAAVDGFSDSAGIPHLTEAFIRKCVDDLRALGLAPRL